MSEFLTFDEFIAIHHQLIEEFGGSHGLINVGALESAVMRPQIGYYQDIIEEAAALMESLAMNHPFVDGNKRMAFFATDAFLRLNGHYMILFFSRTQLHHDPHTPMIWIRYKEFDLRVVECL